MSGFLPTEKGTPIRYPSVANLVISTEDRDILNDPFGCWNFQISRPNNLQNGFFTRIAPTEMKLLWCVPNIQEAYPGFEGNTSISVDISGTGGNAFNGTVNATLTRGFYTVAQVLDGLVASLNGQTGTTGATFSVATTPRPVGISCTGAVWRLTPAGITILATQLGFDIFDNTYTARKNILSCPNLQLTAYLDFVSEQLTYAQDVKDSSSATTARNVLLRWYMAWDEQPQLDAYGFPILMGYTQFAARRDFANAKQIRWNTALPVGNISFQIYDSRGLAFSPPLNYAGLEPSEWYMTLQLSEI